MHSTQACRHVQYVHVHEYIFILKYNTSNFDHNVLVLVYKDNYQSKFQLLKYIHVVYIMLRYHVHVNLSLSDTVYNTCVKEMG